MLQRVEAVHGRHLILRDIKPANFVMGSDTSETVFCIDFGLSKRYRNPHTLAHIPHRVGKSLTGTPRYASINNHLGIEQVLPFGPPSRPRSPRAVIAPPPRLCVYVGTKGRPRGYWLRLDLLPQRPPPLAGSQGPEREPQVQDDHGEEAIYVHRESLRGLSGGLLRIPVLLSLPQVRGWLAFLLRARREKPDARHPGAAG